MTVAHATNTGRVQRVGRLTLVGAGVGGTLRARTSERGPQWIGVVARGTGRRKHGKGTEDHLPVTTGRRRTFVKGLCSERELKL